MKHLIKVICSPEGMGLPRIYDYLSFDDVNSDDFSYPCSFLWIDINYISKEQETEAIDLARQFIPSYDENHLINHSDRRSAVKSYRDYIVIDMVILRDEDIAVSVDYLKKHFIISNDIIISMGNGQSEIFERARDTLVHSLHFPAGPDEVLYKLFDYICDEYFIPLDEVEDMVERIETLITRYSSDDIQDSMLTLRKDILRYRRSVTSLKNICYSLSKYDYGIMSEKSMKNIEMVYDNTFKIHDYVNTELENLDTDLELYNSKASNKLNATMEFLTVITTILAPLTLITGIYGMNFKYMPELEVKQGYPVTLLIMIILGVMQVIYFRRKKWL